MDRRGITRVLSAAAALSALGATILGAQDTTKTGPRSTKTIKIRKEAGELAKPVHDTVTVYRTDTLRLTAPPVTVHDTVTRTNTVTVTRIDTVSVKPEMPPVRLPNGMYVGLSGGLSTPNGSLFNPNNTGPSAQVQVGWQDALKVLGVRADVNWTQPAQDAGFVRFDAPHGQIVNVSLDAKAQLPYLHHTFGTSHLFSLYAIGGYTHTSFKNVGLRVNTPDGAPLQFAGPVDSWQNQNGWNAGGGASLMWGRTELFIESRVLAFTPDNAPMARQMPFMFGLNLY